MIQLFTPRRWFAFPFYGVLLLSLCSACADFQPRDFSDSEPALDPIWFFTGPARSWAVMEDGSGNPTSVFTARLIGRIEDGDLILTQQFQFENQRRQLRIWRMRRIDAHHYEATANDIVGIAKGVVYGRALLLEYNVALNPNNSLTHLHFRQWMYLQDDGETIVNRVKISKLGITVVRVTEYFRRGDNALEKR